ncbi:MAG: RNA repair transcriptional activator RtcR [Proteobacteria bacterium]|nr:RNA repair transcriptional activator RtcR [Pseudomonadota bacterium]
MVGLLGVNLDRGHGSKRWTKWRPTPSLFQQDDLEVARMVLLYDSDYAAMANAVRRDIRNLSPNTSVELVLVRFDDPWDFEEVYGALHEFAHGTSFTEDEELLVHITTGTHVAQICLFLLVEAGFLPGKLLQTRPPRRDESVGGYSIIDLDLGRYDRIATRFEAERREATGFLKEGIDTKSPAFNSLIDRIERVAAATTAPLLLMGPTGAGKTRLAKRIAALKQQRKQVEGALVVVNCATIRGDGAMSALFGHVRGAFTGAASDRSGLLRQADGGVLFLDEVGELALDEQAMLLRAIEEKTFLPVGSDREVSSDFQLIAGTNRDLREAVAEGRFREDLLARIDLWTFRLPGLAERREDIEPNLDYELEQQSRLHNRRVRLNREARTRFLQFAGSPEATWTANFRDLNAAVTRMATLSDSGRIDTTVVDEEVGRLRDAWRVTQRDVVYEVMGDLADEMDRFDRAQMAEVITVCRASRSLSEAGRMLFAVSRQRKKSSNDADRLRKYLAKWGLSFDEVRLRA